MANIMEKLNFKTAQNYFKEADGRYQDLKPVREACGTCYLAVLLALDGYFLQRGIDKDKLPVLTEGYEECLRKYLVHNGK